MNDREWLNVLKPGDKVAVQRRYGAGHDITTVDRVTPTQIVTKRGKFRRKDGRSVGSGMWDGAYLRQVTPEILAASQRERALHIFQQIGTERLTLPDSVLLEMADIYLAFKATRAPAANTQETQG